MVVTAQKRSENLQKVPIAVVAVNEDTLKRAGVNTFDNLDKLVPDVQVTRVVSVPTIAIRGIYPTDLGPTSEQPNAVHLDGAYIAKATALNGMFFDIARVEVLKGPQGTLYGRNAAAGAINIVTNHPTQDPGAEGQIEFGSYSLIRAEAALNVPINDKLAARAAFQSLSRSGYFTNGLEDADEKAGRVELLWKPTDKQQLFVSIDSERIRGKGYGVANIIGYVPPPAGPSPILSQYVQPDFNNTALYGNQPPFHYNSNVDGESVQYDYSMDWATFTLQGAHRMQVGDDYTVGGGPLSAPDPTTGARVGTAAGHTIKFNSYSLEARLTSASTRPLQYVAGLFAFEDKDGGYLAIYDHPGAEPFNVKFDNPFERAHSYAAFGQATYTPTGIDSLHLTAGLRYTIDKKVADTVTVFGFQAANPPPADHGQRTWYSTTYRLGISYDLTPRSMIYATNSTGYKSGGFAFGPSGQPSSYNPEHVTAYEAGTKNTFLDGRLQLNLEGFYYNYRDKEVVIGYFTNGIFVITTTNAGKTRIYGASLEAVAAVTDHDRINFNGAYISAEYQSFDLTGINSQLSDLSHTAIPGTPPWEGTLTYDHTWDMFGGEWDAQVSAQYRSRTLMTDFNTNRPNAIFIYGSPYIRTDLSLRYAPAGGKWNITGYVRNVNDSRNYSAKAYDNSTGLVTGILAAPRTFGVMLAAKM